MAPPFPRAGPGVPPVAIALRFGAGPAKAAPTRRSVRRIFPAARVAGKNDSDSFRRWRRKPGRGNPFLDFSPRDGGRESPVGCLLLLEAPAIRLAAGRLWRWEGPLRRQDGRRRFAVRPRGPLAEGELPAARRTDPACLFFKRRDSFSLNASSCRRSGGTCPAAGERSPLMIPPEYGAFPGGKSRRGCAISSGAAGDRR